MSETSTRTAETGTLISYAALRFAGDRLEPDRITALLRVPPTTAYRKGEIYKCSRGHEIRGRTGLWLVSTRRQFDSLEVRDHLVRLLEILFPAGSNHLIEPLRELMREDELEADVICFWYGAHGATPPVISDETRTAFAQISATIDTDFDTD